LDIFHANGASYIGGDLTKIKNSTAIDQMLNLNLTAIIQNVHKVRSDMIDRGTGDLVAIA
jgi:NADP-dependent 3-hydroxy acid dehydrogenase YdfG